MERVKFNATFTWLPSPSMFLPKSPPLWGHSPVSWAGTMVPQGAGGCHNPEVTHLWAGQTQWCHRGPGGCRGPAASHEVPAAIAAPPGLGSASTGPAAESAAGNAPGRWRCPPWWGGHWPWEGGHFSAGILYKSRGPPRSFTPRRPSLTSNSALCSPRSWTPTLSLESCWQTATETTATNVSPVETPGWESRGGGEKHLLFTSTWAVSSHCWVSDGVGSPRPCLWKHSSTNTWWRNTWSLHTLEHHSAMNRGVALTLTTTWTDPEDMMLSERSRHRRTHRLWFHWWETSRTGRSQTQRVGSWLSRAGEGMGVTADEERGFPFGVMKAPGIRGNSCTTLY